MKTHQERKRIIYRLGKILKSIIKIPIKNRRNLTTCFMVENYQDELKMKIYININDEELDKMFRFEFTKLTNRGYCIHNQKNFYIQVLLHEIAHYKQWAHCNFDSNKYIEKYQFDEIKREKAADRYARKYYKYFVNKVDF